jgi:glycosyltransferase involved in cell wall biosynthesis
MNENRRLAGDGKLRVCVATITYRRPVMLAALLESFVELRLPSDTELLFLVVDNEEGGSAASVVNFYRERLRPNSVHYRLEPRRGIPFARNRALDAADAIGVDLLAFVDDDETVGPEWLLNLVAAHRNRGLHLVGGPVRFGEWETGAAPNRWSRLMLQGIRAHYADKERSANERARSGREGEIVVLTNNWLIDMNWLRKTQLRFNERLRFSGGSDALFYNQAKARGIRSGWCCDAVVRERIHPSRATFSHQFTRARSQAIASFHRNYTRVDTGVAIAAGFSCLLKAVGCMACAAMLPFKGGWALVQIARQSGWIVGRIQAIATGGHSSLYLNPDGL